jgi:hypothetical protein
LGCFKYIFIALLFLLNSCCAKVDCVIQTTKEITFKLDRNASANGFTEGEIDSLIVLLQNPATGEIIDSSGAEIMFTGSSGFDDSTSGFNEIELSRNNKSARGANIIIMLPNGSYADTLFDIQFESGLREFSCGSCFFNENKEIVPFIAERSLTYRGDLKTEGDFPILISKK